MIKAIFFDIDGTLLDREGKLSDKTKYALDKLKENGVKRFIASGRHMVEISELPICDYHFDGYVLLNGQLVLDENKNIIDANCLDENDMIILKELFNNKEMPIVFVERDRLYINYENNNVIEAQKSISSLTPKISTYNGDVVYQASIFTDKENIEKLSKKLNNSKITSWHEYGFDLINKNGGKHSGILSILKHYNINVLDTMAFGDGENDISMFEIVGHSIAMGDASKDVLKVAKETTSSAKDDGIYKALIKHGLI